MKGEVASCRVDSRQAVLHQQQLQVLIIKGFVYLLI